MNTKILIRLFLLTLVATGLMACGGKKEPEEAAPAPAPSVVEAKPETDAAADTESADAPANVPANRAGGQGFDLAAAAAELGVSEEALQAAMGQGEGVRPDFAAVAQELGVSREALTTALGMPADASEWVSEKSTMRRSRRNWA